MSNEEHLLRQILSELQKLNKNMAKLETAVGGVERAVWDTAPD